MFATTSPDSAKAALIRQDASRFTRSDPKDRSYIIMSQPLHDQVALTEAECAAIDELVQSWFCQALHVLRSAHQAGGGVAPFSEALSSLDAYRPMAVQR